MLKELLLQFFLSVLPVFSFLLWHDKERGWKGFKPFIAITSGASIILCMLTSTLVHGYDVDFRIVPYLIGSLYGGYPVFLGLSLLYIGTRLPQMDNVWETISFGLFSVLFIITFLVVYRSFQRAAASGRERIGLLMTAVFSCYLIIILNIYINQIGMEWTTYLILEMVFGISGLLLAVWLSIYIIESINEKQLLHIKVNLLSNNYRNEVEKLQQFIDKAPLAVMIINDQGEITHANEESLGLNSLGTDYLDAESLKGSRFRHVFQEDGDNICVNLLQKALQGESANTITEVTGDKILLYTSITIHDAVAGGITGAALIAKDVTELNQLRDEVGRMERLSLVGQMAASITHEIRNPMAVIRGFVQLLQERSPESQHEYYRIIMEELDRTNQIINDFLSLAQNRELKMELASLNGSINDIVPLLLADANLRGQSLQVDLCPDLPSMMLNDREIKQMLLNLARNGMEAMGEKGILSISTMHTEQEVCIHIKDEGVGIPHEKMKHLFEPFFTTKTRGTGLGLPLCLSIAERHRGKIDVQSTEGEGTLFIVAFNILEPDNEHNTA
ncbi:two-component system sensor histidine kinase NtrB [Paenibacillus sp. CAU 1782]